MNISGSIPALFAIPAAAMISAALIWAIRPMLLRHALARPNARSSHRIPTPQGAGIAVIAATLVVSCGIVVWGGAAELKIPLAVFGGRAVHGHGRLRRRRQVHRRAAAAAAAGCRRRRNPARGIRRSADRSGLSAMDRARHPAAGRALVRQSRQLHGRARLDDGGRGGADHGGAGDARPARRISRLGNPRRCGALWRDAGVCAVQPPRRQGLSRRRRQPADRPAARLVPAAARLPAAIRRSPAAAAVLPARRHGDPAAAAGQARAVLGGPSLAFLSARNRQWLYGMARGRRGVCAQHPVGGARGRIDHGRLGRDQDRASPRRECCDGAGDVPIFASAALRKVSAGAAALQSIRSNPPWRQRS